MKTPVSGDSVTVVLPAYNEEERLPRSVQSVFAQTVQPLEILVVNDGSTDRTEEVAQSFGEKVRCITQSHKGVSAARNYGIQQARGSIIAFLDADDEWYPRHLEIAVRHFNSHPDVPWYCGGWERRSHEGHVELIMRCGLPPHTLTVLDDYFLMESRYAFASPQTVVVARSVFETAGVFSEMLHCGEDLDMWFRIALHFPRIGFYSTPVAAYCTRPGSVTDRGLPDSQKRLDFVRHLEDLASRSDPVARKRAEVLILQHAWQDVRHAVLERNANVLRVFAVEYSSRMTKRRRWATKLLAATPSRMLPWVDNVLLMRARMRDRARFWKSDAQ